MPPNDFNNKGTVASVQSFRQTTDHEDRGGGSVSKSGTLMPPATAHYLAHQAAEPNRQPASRHL